MTIDAILEINKAEEEAGRLVGASVENARALLADARTQAARIIAEAEAGGRTAMEEKTLLAERRANSAIEKIKRNSAAECELITKAARTKFAEAAAIIAGRIVKADVDR